jgi:transposase
LPSGNWSYELWTVGESLLRAPARWHKRWARRPSNCGRWQRSRLLHSRGDSIAFRDLLTPIYRSFTQGFDTADLKDAKALLDGCLQ